MSRSRKQRDVPPEPQLDALAADWLGALVLAGRRPMTVADYGKDWRAFRGTLPAQATLGALTARSVLAWLLAHETKPATRRRRLASLRSFVRYGRDAGWLPEDPLRSLRPPTLPRVSRRALTETDVARLLDAPWRVDRAGRWLRNRALLELLYGSALRVGEAVGVRVGDVDLAGGRLYVREAKGGRPRWTPLTRRVRGVLAPLLDGRVPGGPLFPGRGARPISTNWVRTLLVRRARALGIAGVHPHALRRACATHLSRRGAPLSAVQGLLGHSSVAVTELYIGLDFEDQQAVLDRYHPRA